jgi:hypothetical protein
LLNAEITFYWCKFHEHVIVSLVPPQYCCLVTSGPYFKVILFQFYFLGSKFLLRSFLFGVTVQQQLILFFLSCINDIHIPHVTNCIQTTEPMWVKRKKLPWEHIFSRAPLHFSLESIYNW